MNNSLNEVTRHHSTLTDNCSPNIINAGISVVVMCIGIKKNVIRDQRFVKTNLKRETAL